MKKKNTSTVGFDTTGKENKGFRVFKTNLTFAQLILNSILGCALVAALMRLINKVDARSVKQNNENNLRSDHNDRSIFMRNWFLKYGSVYYQTE